MLYALVGTDQKKREKAQLAFAKFGSPTAHIYGEQVSALEPLIEATSLFGDKIVVHLVQTMERAETRERVYDLLGAMKESPNVFIIDEPFADANRVKKIEKAAEALYDAREEKEKEVSPFSLTNALARRDKKNLWVEWMKIRDHLEGEAIQGALWWKFQSIWSDTLLGRPSKFSKEECERLGKRIVESSILAHRGEKDLKVELESIFLSV